MTDAITFGRGYTPSLIGRIVTLHADYYAQLAGFGAAFEAKVAHELADFVARLDHTNNEIWWASNGDEVIAGIAIDGQRSPQRPAVLHWFIVHPKHHGQGLGRDLMDRAMAFCDARDIPTVELSTFAGLDAARVLYERAGFVLVSEKDGRSWGRTVTEQTFVRHHPDSANAP
ncbi:MAG: GNAT family N-acetyltransferase [Pseudomonadota bacterium]